MSTTPPPPQRLFVVRDVARARRSARRPTSSVTAAGACVRDWRGKTNVLNGPQLFDAALPVDRHPSPWNHADYVPDVVVVSLGTNDFNLDLGPLPEREAYVSAALSFLRTIRGRYPNAQLFVTEGAIVNDEQGSDAPAKEPAARLSGGGDTAPRRCARRRRRITALRAGDRLQRAPDPRATRGDRARPRGRHPPRDRLVAACSRDARRPRRGSG